MKLLVAGMALTCFFIQSPAWAIVSPAPDQMGLYFDTDADWICVEDVPPYVQLDLYLILTRPTPEFINGFQVGVEILGEFLVLEVFLAGEAIINADTVFLDGLWPQPEATSEAMVLATIRGIYLSTTNSTAYFGYGGRHDISGELPAIQLTDGSWVEMEMILPYSPWMAAINEAGCYLIPVATKSNSFDSLKALYR